MSNCHQAPPADEEALDPRIQHELDVMNTSADLINKLENNLALAQQKFKEIYEASLGKLNKEMQKVGPSIHKALPYYECRRKVKELQENVYNHKVKYDKAVSMESAAREMVEVTEKGCEAKRSMKSPRNLVWPEMLNHATNKLLELEADTFKCKVTLLAANSKLADAQTDVRRLYKRNKRSISKSKSYYEMKSHFHHLLEGQKGVIADLERDCSKAKSYYSESMANLESISNEIHSRRQRSNTSSSDNTSTGELSAPVQAPGSGEAYSHKPAETVAANGVPDVCNNLTPSEKICQRFAIYDTPENSDDESDESDGPGMKRSESCREMARPIQREIITKPRSNSAPSFGQNSDESLCSSCSSAMLDDVSVDGAASLTYFDSENFNHRSSAAPIIYSPPLATEDYYTLPTELSGYQKQYTLRREASVISKQVKSAGLSDMLNKLHDAL